MSPPNDSRFAHEAMRGMRPDAHRFIRPDWRRFVRPGCEGEAPFDFYECFERKYSPDQPRVPAGNSDGGQWTSEGGGGSNAKNPAHVKPAQRSPADRTRSAGLVIPICIVGTKAVYGDGTYKVTYICADGREFTREGVGRIQGVIRQPPR